MIFASAKAAAPAAASTDATSLGPASSSTSDAHRSFCDIFEEDGSLILSSSETPPSSRQPVDVAEASASATAEGPTGTGSTARKAGANTGERTLGTGATVTGRFFEEAAASVRQGLVGRNAPFRTPYGMKPLVYSDWTATGRAVGSIEAFIGDQVAPLFGNTHTTTSITGAQTTCFRHEARQIIAQAVNAKVTGRAAEDVVLFTGTGATAAVAKLVSALGLAGPLPPGCSPDNRPVIFVGPFEHHSNLLPWRESCGEVVTIGEHPSSGGLDLSELEEQLRKFAGRKLKIGSFSAASNVTGALEDVDRVTAALHRAGALALWDYATAAPYVHVDMNPAPSDADNDQALLAKDAIFFSGHKFVGGPGTPGVLVVKKRLLCNAVPGTVGGGTVFFVTKNDHRYLSNKEEREEGGTPDILGSIRLGLAVQMKDQLGRRGLMEREEALAALGLKTLRAHPRVVVLGDTGRKRLPIFSFLVRTDRGRFLHYNFVCSLLNDLFGVQSRGGCQCAGPYSQLLLGMTLRDTRAVEAELLHKHELLRPGFSRLSLSYVNSDEEAKYILDAVLFVADHGAAFLPYYRLNYKTGEWKHKTRFTRFPERRWLGNCDYGFPAKAGNIAAAAGAGIAIAPGKSSATNSAVPASSGPAPKGKGDPEPRSNGVVAGAKEEGEMLSGVFEEAARHLEAAEAGVGEARWQGSEDVLSPEGEALRWFLYPWEGGGSGRAGGGGGGGSTHSKASSDSVASDGRGSGNANGSACCIIKPKVYGSASGDGGRWLPAGAAADAPNATDAETTTVTMTPDAVVGGVAAVERATGDLASNGGGGVVAPAVLGTATAAGAATETDDGHGERVEAPAENGGGVFSAAAATVTGRAGTPPPLPPASRDRGLGSGSAARSPAARDTAPQKTAKKEPDDSHKYPLRQASKGGGGGGGGGETGGFVLAAETPPFLASSSATGGGVGSGGTSSSSAVAVNGDAADKSGGGGSVSITANGNRSNSGSNSSKLKGYERHMSALGKLGEGSAESRLFPKPGKKLLKVVGQAVQAWKMIEDGDRLCLGLSGGKDSMTLLHVLLDLQKRAPINFEVACATVDPQTSSFDPSPLIPYLERLGVKLHYLSSPIIEQAKTSMKGDSLCAFCARMKRGLLYACCRDQGYNKLVLAQHLDDLAESFIMSALHNGQVRTMKANYKIEAGDVRVIRPLCYARESLTKDFARTNRLPVVNENCPACFEEPKERHRVKKMLAKEESLFPTMYANLRKALVPLMDDDAYTSMNKTSAEVAARQVERHSRPPTRRRDLQARAQQDYNPVVAAATPAGTRDSVAVSLDVNSGVGSTAPGNGEPQPSGNSSSGLSELTRFSDDALERELRRRRGGGGGGVGVGVGGAEGAACGQDGGVCVPCFEIA